MQNLINQAEARHGPARKEPMNDAQKNAIREADNYLRCAGLPTYSQVTAQPAAVSDEQIVSVFLSDRDDGSADSAVRIGRAILALRPAAQEVEISTKHGPWLPSRYHDGETYCQRCLTRSIFASNRACDPHIVPAPQQAAPEPEWRDRLTVNLLRQGSGLTKNQIRALIAHAVDGVEPDPTLFAKATPESVGEPDAWQERQTEYVSGAFGRWYNCTGPSPRAAMEDGHLSLTTGGITYQWRPLYTRPAPATQAVPMTSGWRNLRDGETFMAGDRMLCNGKHWHIVEDGSHLIGREFDQLQHYPAQRLTSGMDHHGITAQQGAEQAEGGGAA